MSEMSTSAWSQLYLQPFTSSVRDQEGLEIISFLRMKTLLIYSNLHRKEKKVWV